METITAVVSFTEEQWDLISIIILGFLTTVKYVFLIRLFHSLYTGS